MVSVQVRRQQVGYATQRGLSERRACTLLSVGRSALHYRSKLTARDAPILWAMRELSAQYPRYGYRRIQVFLEREGFVMSADKARSMAVWMAESPTEVPDGSRVAGPRVDRRVQRA
jgi:putative transposase